MKKNLILSFAVVMLIGMLAACDQGDKATELTNKNDSVAYVIGTNIGANLIDNITRDSLDLPIESLVQGFRDALNKVDTIVFTSAQKQAIMMEFQQELQQKQMEQMTKEAQPNKDAGMQFLAENKTREGVIETQSGLQYKVIKMGKGTQPAANDSVTVHYEGKLLDGKIFDSSYERKQPATFVLSQVIRGWQEGLMLMKEGSTFELYIPSDLAYGDQGNQNIPGGSALIFKVELIKVKASAGK